VAIPGIGPVAATGWLAATAAGAAAGSLAGGALGVVSQAGVSGEEAHAIAECLRRGATLVTARVSGASTCRSVVPMFASAVIVGAGCLWRRADRSVRCGSEHPGRPEGEDARARAAVPQSILLRAGGVIEQAATLPLGQTR